MGLRWTRKALLRPAGRTAQIFRRPKSGCRTFDSRHARTLKPLPLRVGSEIHFRYRRRHFFTRQRNYFRLAGQAFAGPRVPSHHPEVRPLHQHRPRYAEPVRARRVLRDRRRGRNRPRPRPLRAVPEHAHLAGQQRHHRPHLRPRHPPRARRCLPRQNRAGGPPHHRRNQAAHAAAGPERPVRRRHHRNRRLHRRHREPALRGGRAPAPLGAARCRLAGHPPHAGALPEGRRRAQNQAHPALGARFARGRPPARHSGVPHRAPHAGRYAPQNRAVLQRQNQLGYRKPRCRQHLLGAAAHAQGGPR